MSKTKQILFLIFWATTTLSSTLVQAYSIGSDYQEVSYDDLLNELSSKKRKITNYKTSSFDTVRLHAGVGFANSFSNIAAAKQNFNRHASGIQVSLGMDLFNPNWYSEGIFKNYGVNTSGSEEMSLRELDLKIGYTNSLEKMWSYTIASGLSNRFLSFSDTSRGIDVDSTTPSLIVSTGFQAKIHQNVSLGAEVSAHSAIVSQTVDKSSFDFAIRINTSL
jgi:hypothetical protein